MTGKKFISDKQLWQEIVDGDRDSFEILYRRYVKTIYREINKRVNDKSAVEDLVQDVFLTLWERRNRYHPEDNLFAYLYGMAVNRVLNHFRTKTIHSKHIEFWENIPESAIGLEELSHAFKQAHNQELETLFSVALKSLPPRMRQVYQLKYEENKRVAEIAKLLDTSPNTIHNQLKAIRKKFILTVKNSSYFFFL